MTKLGAQIGDTIRLEDTTKVSLLKNTEFKVVGSCVHPDHLVTPNRFGDYVLVSKEAFDQTLLAGRFPYAELVIEKEEGTTGSAANTSRESPRSRPLWRN